MKYFLDKYWALAIPIYLEVLIICAILVFAGLILILSKQQINMDEDYNKLDENTNEITKTMKKKN
jgi:cell division protein FtsI/penicillin-binding protein 2